MRLNKRRIPWGVGGLLVLLALASPGCFGQPEHHYTGVGLRYWNESPRELRIILENGYGLPGSEPYNEIFKASARRGEGGGSLGASWGCNAEPHEPWPFRITLHDNATGQRWSYTWSDIGCGVNYEFVYHADGTTTMKLVSKSPGITKTDLPRK